MKTAQEQIQSLTKQLEEREKENAALRAKITRDNEAQQVTIDACYQKVKELEKELEEAKGWISVEDRLPEDQEPVVLTGDMPPYRDSWTVIGYFFEPTEEFMEYGNSDSLSFVTHWKPLPEPPNKSTNT